MDMIYTSDIEYKLILLKSWVLIYFKSFMEDNIINLDCTLRDGGY